jgi:DNA-binding transcriptional MerR regulator
VHDDQLLGIGVFAVLGGLTIGALRHYDEIGLLRPAHVDPQTRYRYYARSQLAAARTVRSLRELDVPLDEIARIAGAAREDRDAMLAEHRARLAAQAHLLAEKIAALDLLTERRDEMPRTTTSRIVMINVPVRELEAARRFYEALLEVEFAEERHEGGPTHLTTTFGEWETPGWFLLALWPDESRAGGGDLGFLVGALDEAYDRALAHGGSALQPPAETPGMPRNAQLLDPSGNRIGLYEG